jgi:hypothetical protein
VGSDAVGLRSFLLALFFRKMTANEAATHGTDNGVMSGIMTGDPADHGTLDTARSVSRTCRHEQGRAHQNSNRLFHCQFSLVIKVGLTF